MEPYTDEIDLREYILVLWRYRKMILALFLAAVLTSGLISFLVLQPVYESNATLYLGNFSSPVYSNPSAAREIFLSDELLSVVAKEFIPGFELKDLQSFKKSIKAEEAKGTPYIKIAVTYNDPAQAQSMVKRVIDLFKERSQPVYEQERQLIMEQQQKVNAQLEQVKQQIAAAEVVMSSLESSNLTEAARDFRRSQTLETLMSLNSQHMSLEGSYFSLARQLQDLKPLRVISGPDLPTTPIKPNKKLNVAVAGVLSLMLGAFLAFVIEYFTRNPLDLKASSTSS